MDLHVAFSSPHIDLFTVTILKSISYFDLLLFKELCVVEVDDGTFPVAFHDHEFAFDIVAKEPSLLVTARFHQILLNLLLSLLNPPQFPHTLHSLQSGVHHLQRYFRVYYIQCLFVPSHSEQVLVLQKVELIRQSGACVVVKVLVFYLRE